MNGPPRRSMVLRAVGDETSASTRHRVLAHRAALEVAGWDTEVRFPRCGGRPGPFRGMLRLADLVDDLITPKRVDLLFVHRKTFPVALADRIRRAASRLVFDMDDAIDLPPPSREMSERENRRYRRRFEATVNAFDLVLCGNPELAARVPHDRVELLPTPVDTVRFTPSRLRRRGGTTLGWVGHSDNLAYLESLEQPFRELTRRHPDLRLVVVADRPPTLQGVEVEFRRWSLGQELASFDGIDIGLMPLEDTPWARGKCAFKAIQFLSLAIPTVASPVGMNGDVVRDGETGFLASDTRQWVEAVDRLLADPALARRLGEAGRRLVERDYSLEVVSRRLIEILEGVVGV